MNIICSFVGVHYEVGKLLERFKPFIDNEIKVFIFHGDARVYLQLLHEASLFDFATSRYV